MIRCSLLVVTLCHASCLSGGAFRAWWLASPGGAVRTWARARSTRLPGMDRSPCELLAGVRGHDQHVPIVDFSSLTEEEAAQSVVDGLKGSGFLLVRSPEITEEKADKVLGLIKAIFQPQDQGRSSVDINPKLGEAVEVHSKDPKAHVMLEGLKNFRESPMADPLLVDYWQSLAAVKRRILTALGRGLGLPADYFTSRHTEDNDSLRLLHYLPLSPEQMEQETLRCKEHSDYGTITLLLRDDCAGLQLLREGHGWRDVPYEPGTLVVNAGSMLRDWTGGAVKATLHRVAAVPEASQRHRYSCAYFVDVDKNVKLKDIGQQDSKLANLTAAAYVRLRAGDDGVGVAYLPGEAEDQGAL